MPEFSVDFEVFCSCGAPLCNKSEGRNSRNRGLPQVVVSPCEKCLQKEYDAGYEDGHKQGHEDGKKDYESA